MGRKTYRWAERLFEKYGRCISCGRKSDLVVHHIIPCHPYEKLFRDIDNGVVLCKSCHAYYHQNYFPINEETLIEFLNSEHKPHPKNKSKKKYKRKEYTPHNEYSKIKINDFTKPKKRENKKEKKKKRKRKRKRSVKRFNPIYLVKNLGCDEWEYMERINLEKEVLGDYI